MIKFENIDFLNYLWALPLLLVIFLWFLHWKRSTLKRYGEYRVISRLIPEMSGGKNWLKFSVFVAAIALLIVAIANPQVGSQLEKQERKGVDIIIALDVSNSMLAEDIRPNRIERARQAVNRFIDRLGEDRIGLIVFAGKAYPLLPLTNDHAAAKMFLNNATTDIVPVQGTSIADAVDLAIRSFPAGQHGKALIIITDGEDHEGDVIKKVEEARSKGIVVHSIGIGSAQGVPIPLFRNGVRVGFRTTRDGQTVITKLNESILQQVAATGQGIYVRATNAQFGLTRVFEEINQMEKGEFEGKVFSEFESRFHYFLYLVLILLIFELLVFERSSRWFRKLSKVIPLLIFFLVSSAGFAQSENRTIRKGNQAYRDQNFQEAELNYRKAIENNNNSFRGNFNLGNATYRQENFEEASSAFQRAIANQTDKTALSKAFYNYGNSLLLNQQIPESVEAYKNALRLNPKDDDARYNLAFAMHMLQQQEQQQKQQGGDQNDKNQDKQDQQQDQQQGDDDQKQDPAEQQQAEQQQPQQISKQEAERMLQALKEEELKTLDKVKEERFREQRVRTEKDW